MSNHELPIAWEKHPVSAERKAELRAQGYTIFDAQFAPEGYEPAEADAVQHRPEAQPAEAAPKRRGRPPKAPE